MTLQTPNSEPESHHHSAAMFLALIFMFSMLCAFFASGSQGNSTKKIWETVNNLEISKVDHIEIQYNIANDKKTSTIINDKEVIEDFLTILKTSEKYLWNHFSPVTSVQINLVFVDDEVIDLITNERTIGFELCTVEGMGNTIFLKSLNMTGGYGAYGEESYPDPALYDWLVNAGVPMKQNPNS